MSFRGRGGKPMAPPKNYVPGLGRGAAGFTTRSDVGPMLSQPMAETGSGSRAAEQRAARLRMQQQQNVTTPFGVAPANYVPGAGRGAGAFKGDDEEGLLGSYDEFGGYMERPAEEGQYDEDDDEADQVWAAVEERMSQRRKKRKQDEVDESLTTQSKISADFRELKDKLAEVTEDQWESLPDVGDYSLKYKQKRRQQNETFTPLSDSLLDQRSKINLDASAGNMMKPGSAAALDTDGTKSSIPSVSGLSGLSAARGTVLGMSLDRMSDSVSGHTTIDPQGYLTSLSNTKIATSTEVGDINKARLLLKSVRDTNPKHGPGWIAAARVEEAAGKMLQARKIIQEACEVCPENEDVWLEAARLHPTEVAKSILATAARRIPTSVKLFLKAADLELGDNAKKAVLRKGLEANPTSVTLWKAAIDLEEAEDARILLSVAVEKIPHSVDMWLALARLESYENAQKVLNKARKALPAERSIWIAAAKLEESQNHIDVVQKIVDRAVKSLSKNEAVVTRAQWIEEAEMAESAGAPETCSAIIKCTIGKDVEDLDRQRTWAEDAKAALSRGSIATARAILSHALEIFPTKRTIWMQAVDLERKHGSPDSLDRVLADASEKLPNVEIFWLLRAKERWVAKDVDKAREIITKAFAANPESEAIWLAAVKLEWESEEFEIARVLLERAKTRAPTARVYMKSAMLERELDNNAEALKLIEEGISKYPKFPKFYMMGGQICSENLEKSPNSLALARKFYQRGLEACPDSITLWILASRLEEQSATFGPEENGALQAGFTKARGILELARLKNPKTPQLWLEAIRLERRSGSPKLADSLMAKALQECPKSGILLAENITTAPRVEQKSKSATAIKRCPDDPHVITAVASLFAAERKIDKARKWFDRAAVLNPDLGDSWAHLYAFELENGTLEQRAKVKERCVAADPKHGEIWTAVMKDLKNRRISVGEGLELTAKQILQTR